MKINAGHTQISVHIQQ